MLSFIGFLMMVLSIVIGIGLSMDIEIKSLIIFCVLFIIMCSGVFLMTVAGGV